MESDKCPKCGAKFGDDKLDAVMGMHKPDSEWCLTAQLARYQAVAEAADRFRQAVNKREPTPDYNSAYWTTYREMLTALAAIPGGETNE